MLYLKALATGAVVLFVALALFAVLILLLLTAFVFRPGAGSPDELRRLPAASLLYPGSEVLSTWDDGGGGPGGGSAQAFTTYSRPPGTEAAEEVIAWYEHELRAMGWHFYGASTYSSQGILREAMWCTTQAGALLTLWFRDPKESPRSARIDREFERQLQATDPDRPNGSCAPSVTPESASQAVPGHHP